MATNACGARAAYCFCCDLELDTEQTKPIPQAMLWLWGPGAVVVYMTWLLCVSAAVAAASKRMQAGVATGASFAVELNGPDVAKASDEEIIEFARHYGAVAQVVRPTTVGVALTAAAKVRPRARCRLRRWCLCGRPLHWAHWRPARGAAAIAACCVCCGLTLRPRRVAAGRCSHGRKAGSCFPLAAAN